MGRPRDAGTAESARHVLEERRQFHANRRWLASGQLRDNLFDSQLDLVIASLNDRLQFVNSFLRSSLPEIPDGLGDFEGVADEASTARFKAALPIAIIRFRGIRMASIPNRCVPGQAAC